MLARCQLWWKSKKRRTRLDNGAHRVEFDD
jgi:hypothetical protein